MGSEATVFGDDPVAGSKLAVGIGMESLADTAGVTGAESTGKLTISCHLAGWNLTGQFVDLGEETHTVSILYFVGFTAVSDSCDDDYLCFYVNLVNNSIITDSYPPESLLVGQFFCLIREWIISKRLN